MSDRRADVSVIVVGRNNRDLLEACLSSIEASLGKNLSGEVFYVDNGSSDGSLELVERGFPRVMRLDMAGNHGFARANNRAMRWARGRHIVLVNTDARLRPGTLETVVGVLDGDPSIGMAGAYLVHPDGRPQNSYHPFPTLATELINRSLLKRLFPGRFSGRLDRRSGHWFEVEGLLGAFMAVRRELIAHVGPLDERYFFFLEETDWCLRARRAGWRIVVVEGTQVVHLLGASANRFPMRSRVEFMRSRYLYFDRNHGRFAAGLLAAGLLVRSAAKLAFWSAGCIVTLGVWRRARAHAALAAWLLGWHLTGCSRRWGLSNAECGMRNAE